MRRRPQITIDVVAAEAGVRVPEEMALIGFHDIPTARYTTPALTTIGHPLIELGEMAAESLFVLLGGGEVAERDRTVPVSLVVRESCGATERPLIPTLSQGERKNQHPMNGLGGLQTTRREGRH